VLVTTPDVTPCQLACEDQFAVREWEPHRKPARATNVPDLMVIDEGPVLFRLQSRFGHRDDTSDERRHAAFHQGRRLQRCQRHSAASDQESLAVFDAVEEI
jgi:hypothetical protein